MILVIQNNSSDSYSYLSGRVSISANSNTEISYLEWYNLSFEQDFWVNIKNNNFIVSDGITTYQYPDSESYIKNLIASNVPTRDTDGAQIVRIKAAKRGWTFAAIPIEFKTAEIGSLYSKTSDGQNRAGITLKFYDSNGTEITTEGLAEVNETTIIRSIVDFEPPYDYEVIGGTLRIGSDIAFDCRLWIIAVPDIPAASGGSKEMAGGLNLKFLAPQQLFSVDGRVSKALIYDATYHTNKLRFIFEHQAGSKTDIHINIELFRQ
jgi:hypothetical protein